MLSSAIKQSGDVSQRLETSYQRENERLKSVISSMQANVSEAFERACVAESNTIAVEDRLVQSLKQTSFFQDALQDLQHKYDELQQKSLSELIALQRNMSSLETVSNENIADKQATVAELAVALERNATLDAEITATRQELATSLTRIDSLVSELTTLSNRVNVLSMEKNDLEQQVSIVRDFLSAQLMEASGRAQSIEEQLNTETVTRERLQNEYASLVAKFDDVVEEHRVDRTRVLATAEGRIIEMRRQHEEQMEALRYSNIFICLCLLTHGHN